MNTKSTESTINATTANELNSTQKRKPSTRLQANQITVNKVTKTRKSSLVLRNYINVMHHVKQKYSHHMTETRLFLQKSNHGVSPVKEEKV